MSQSAIVPKDLSKIKSKVLFNLTKRQLICFTPAVLIGVPLFFATRNTIGNSSATLVMILVMMPFFLLAMYQHNEEPMEVYLRHLVRTKFIRPAKRPYITNNLYAYIDDAVELEKEVNRIIRHEEKDNRKKKNKEKRKNTERKGAKKN